MEEKLKINQDLMQDMKSMYGKLDEDNFFKFTAQIADEIDNDIDSKMIEQLNRLMNRCTEKPIDYKSRWVADMCREESEAE